MCVIRNIIYANAFQLGSQLMYLYTSLFVIKMYQYFPVVTCPTPTAPPFSTLRFVSGSSYVYGSSVRVTCNSGYSLSGTALRTCQANGRWSGTAPSCTSEYGLI